MGLLVVVVVGGGFAVNLLLILLSELGCGEGEMSAGWGDCNVHSFSPPFLVEGPLCRMPRHHTCQRELFCYCLNGAAWLLYSPSSCACAESDAL